MPKFSYSIIRLFSYSVTGAIGWMLGGPLGGVLGFVAGAVIGSFYLKKEEKKPIGIFSTNLLMLIAAVLKTKMPVTDSKIDFLMLFLKKNYGEKLADEAFVQLNEIQQNDIPLDDACKKICRYLDYASRLQLVQFLYKLVKIDGKLTEIEHSVLDFIATGLKVKPAASAVTVQDNSLIAAYKLLNINRKSSVADIKKAYRKLVVECHPDKVAQLGEEQKKAANEKFLHLSKAYEIIKKERKF